MVDALWVQAGGQEFNTWQWQIVFEAGKDMDEDTREYKEVQSPPPNANKPEQLVKYLRKVSREFSSTGYLKHSGKNIRRFLPLMLTSRLPLKGDLLNALNGVTKVLRAIQDVVKEDLVLNKKVLEATEEHLASWAKSSISMAWNLGHRIPAVEKIYKSFKGQSSALLSSVPQTTLAITKGPTNVKGKLLHRLTLKNLPLTLKGSMLGNEYRQRDKTKAKPDKTEHEMESVEKSKVNQSQKKVNPVKVKDEAEVEELLNGPT
nr:hypothetical protein [Tanacetum cinerariifolium]